MAAELDEEANGFGPDVLSWASSRQVWWRCSQSHQWKAFVSARTRLAQGCPFCSGARPTPGVSTFAALQPDLMRSWDTTRNVDVDPDALAEKSSVKVWWRCEVAPDHRWMTSPKMRVGGNGCPACSGNQVSRTNSLETLSPLVARELDPEKSGFTAAEVTNSAHRRAWWRCSEGHSYDMPVSSRTGQGQRCPYCSGKRNLPGVTSLAALHPELLSEWDYERNTVDPDHVRPGSNTPVHWVCAKAPHHKWLARPLHRVGVRSGCPFCSGARVAPETALSTVHPDLAVELDTERSGITAEELHTGSNRKVWWACAVHDSHRWRTAVFMRTANGTRCPFCTGDRASPTHNLALKFPALAAELDPTLNAGLTAEGLTPFSGQRVTWRCSADGTHTWKTSVGDRSSSGNGCPECSKGRRTSIREIAMRNCLAEVLPDVSAAPVDFLGRQRWVDASSPLLKLIVEYDGAYFHRDRQEQDQRKNDIAHDHGWTLVRVRESPLTPLGPLDVCASFRTDLVEVCVMLVASLRSRWPDIPPLDRGEAAKRVAEAKAEYAELRSRGAHRRADTRPTTSPDQPSLFDVA